MIDIPFVDTVATGQNIDRLRNAAGLSVKDMQGYADDLRVRDSAGDLQVDPRNLHADHRQPGDPGRSAGRDFGRDCRRGDCIREVRIKHQTRISSKKRAGIRRPAGGM